MNRFLLFGGDNFYLGWGDFIEAVETLEQAEKRIVEWLKQDASYDGFGQIVDAQTMQILSDWGITRDHKNEIFQNRTIRMMPTGSKQWFEVERFVAKK